MTDKLAAFCAQILLALPLLGWDLPEELARETSQNHVVAFVEVGLVPMDKERVLLGQTVIIRDGRITEIGKSSAVKVPENALRVDGRGLYLMPGLADMHFHLHNKQDLMLLVVNGVTTIRNLRGTPLHLAWREKIANGEMLGPSIYTAGPILDGMPPSGENVTVVETAEEANRAVYEQKRAGYDFIKVYNRLSSQAYNEILKAAKSYRMPVIGHVPAAVGLKGVLSSGQSSIEHLTGYMSAIKSNAPTDPQKKVVIEKSVIEDLAKATRIAGVWNCATLIVQQKLSEVEEFKSLKKFPEIQYVAPLRLAMWNPTTDVHLQSRTRANYEAARRGIVVLKRLTKALHDAGAQILLGTDAPSRFVVPGFSIHEELQSLVQAGLTPYEAIQAGTRNAAEFLGGLNEFGTIETGKRADFILIKGHPFKNISNIKRVAGVMIRGRWLPEKKITAILNEIVTSYKTPANRFSRLPDLTLEGTPEAFGQYEIWHIDFVVGEERLRIYRMPDGHREIVAQQVTDPPFDTIYSLHVILDVNGKLRSLQLESERPEGKGHYQIRQEGSRTFFTGSLPAQKELDTLEEELPEDVALSAAMLAARVPLFHRLKSLEKGNTEHIRVKELEFGIFFNKGFELQDATWKAEREPDANGLHVYRIEKSCRFQMERGMVSLDDYGMPFRFQKGTRLFLRVK